MDVKASCQACMMISKSGQVRLPKSSSELVVLVHIWLCLHCQTVWRKYDEFNTIRVFTWKVSKYFVFKQSCTHWNYCWWEWITSRMSRPVFGTECNHGQITIGKGWKRKCIRVVRTWKLVQRYCLYCACWNVWLRFFPWKQALGAYETIVIDWILLLFWESNRRSFNIAM